MLRKLFLAAALAVLFSTGNTVRADEDLCVDGVCYLTKEAADRARAEKAAREAAGLRWQTVDDDAEDDEDSTEVRMRMGMCDEAAFLGFLRGEESGDPADDFADKGFWVLLLIAFACGLMDNLTPCVLPLVPVNIAIIGRSAGRGAIYGLGQITGAGTRGLLAALAGMQFGAVQSSVAFNVAAALAMCILGLAMLDVIHIDLSRFRSKKRSGARRGAGAAPRKPVFGVWALGAASVLLAGACVEPVLIAILLKTAEGVGGGAWQYAALPFAFGAGLALPWPFIGAGLGILPKPGVWMVWLKRVLSLVVFAFAARYAYLAVRLWSPPEPPEQTEAAEADGDAPVLWILSAPWCLNCHEMEATVLKRPAVLEEMKRFNVKHVTIDKFEDLKAYPSLSGLDIKGLPCYVIEEAE